MLCRILYNRFGVGRWESYFAECHPVRNYNTRCPPLARNQLLPVFVEDVLLWSRRAKECIPSGITFSCRFSVWYLRAGCAIFVVFCVGSVSFLYRYISPPRAFRRSMWVCFWSFLAGRFAHKERVRYFGDSGMPHAVRYARMR